LNYAFLKASKPEIRSTAPKESIPRTIFQYRSNAKSDIKKPLKTPNNEIPVANHSCLFTSKVMGFLQ
jgi:hypothetical protein